MGIILTWCFKQLTWLWVTESMGYKSCSQFRFFRPRIISVPSPPPAEWAEGEAHQCWAEPSPGLDPVVLLPPNPASPDPAFLRQQEGGCSSEWSWWDARSEDGRWQQLLWVRWEASAGHSGKVNVEMRNPMWDFILTWCILKPHSTVVDWINLNDFSEAAQIIPSGYLSYSASGKVYFLA